MKEKSAIYLGRRGTMVKWSWRSAAIGAASAAAASALVLAAKPKDPTFHLTSIALTSLNLNFPFLDAELVLTVRATNPNIVAVDYSPATMAIFYDGALLGSARVEAGSQPPRSSRILRLPARLDALELAHHAGRFLADVARREMALDAAVEVGGAAKVLWWDHRFKLHVDGNATVDPLCLGVVDQGNKSNLKIEYLCW